MEITAENIYIIIMIVFIVYGSILMFLFYRNSKHQAKEMYMETKRYHKEVEKILKEGGN